MLLVCPCVQAIMVCLGKRCKANCTFSAEKYTWFTVWKLPPHTHTHTHKQTTISCVNNNQNKTEHKRPVFFTTSDRWQFWNSSAQCVSTLSEHFHRYWDVFTQSTVAPVHTTRSMCDKGNCANRVLFFLLEDIRQATPNSQEMTSKTMILSLCAACPRGQNELWLLIRHL